MNEEMLKLLDSINKKKQEVKDLVEAGEIEKAKNAKKELQEMQDKFDDLNKKVREYLASLDVL